MIIRWREWSSDRHGDREPAQAGATMPLTRLSLVPYAGDVANACRSVRGAPSRRVMQSFLLCRSKHREGARRNFITSR